MKETLIISKDDCIGVSLAAFKKVLAKDHPLMLQYYQRWDGPAFLSANFLLAQTA